MKTIGYCSTLFVVMFILFQLAGCGKGEDEARDVNKQVVPEATAPQNIPGPSEPLALEQAAPQAVAEQRSDTGGQDNIGLTETQPAIREVPDLIMIDNQGYESDRKGRVKFSHLKHIKEYKASCIECHHLYQDGRNIWKEGDHVNKCVVCHDPVEEKGKAVKLQSAFHNNCRDSHTKASQEGREAPYKKCSECHGERGQDV
jgi:hypothetical protein